MSTEMSMGGMSLSGRRALVTGGAGGIGAAIARDLSAMGATVLIADKNLEGARAVAASLVPTGTTVEVDLTSTSSVAEMIARTLGGGPVDILVNNAGWDKVEPFLDSAPETWDRLLAINLRAPIQITHGVLGQMLERGWGRIVSISSDAGRGGSSGEAVYAAAKAGIVGFTKTIAREAARKGVTANTVAPGPTDTALLREVLEEKPKFIEALQRAIPIGRFGTPEDISGLVAFLCSDRAAYITGQVVSVNGGLLMP